RLAVALAGADSLLQPHRPPGIGGAGHGTAPAHHRGRRTSMREDATMWRSTIGLIVTCILSLLAAPLAAKAPSLARVPRIGWLASGSPPSETNRLPSPFLQGLRESGWVEGQNLVIEYRWAEGNHVRLPELAAELVQLKVNIIVAGDSSVIAAAQHAT